MSGNYRRGMIGEGEAIHLTFARPAWVASFVGKAVSLSSTYEGVAVTGWTEESRTADAIVFRLVPVGSEFDSIPKSRTQTQMVVHHELSIDGQLQRYPPTIEPLKDY